MFGNTSPTKEEPPVLDGARHESPEGRSDDPTNSKDSSEPPPTEQQKKRRSSGISKVVQSARNSLHLGHISPKVKDEGDSAPKNPFSKLSKNDPALIVPQGPNNNSAGESNPTPRSTFRVGVSEDKNKKCRRTMEDTHAFLYNFLSTPAPNIDSEAQKLSSDEAESIEKSENVHDKVIETDNGYFAIFDGHAGTFTADWCGKKLHLLLEENIKKNPTSSIPEMFDQTFTLADQELEKLPLKNSGCTAVTAVLRWEDRIPSSKSATGSANAAPAAAAAAAAASKDEARNSTEAKSKDENPTIDDIKQQTSRQRVLYTANVGDARIVLCRDGKALRLSYDHKGSDEYEGKRVTNAGGLILNNRVNGVLAVTRALGDAYMKQLITGHPYTTETVIQHDIDEFIILACDGLWDVCTDQEAVDHIRDVKDPQLASKMLVDLALTRFSTDNLSCMIVRFDSEALKATFNQEKPPIGVEGDPPVKPDGLTEAEAIVLEAKAKAEKGELPSTSTKESVLEEDAGPEKEKEKVKYTLDENGEPMVVPGKKEG